MPLLGIVAEPISIPFETVPLPGYVFRPGGDDDQPRPTVLIPGGFDGTCEEMFKYGAHYALAQGWNAVTWDGPGQGGLLIEHGVTMRPDFESVLTPVVDWALGQPYVSADALGPRRPEPGRLSGAPWGQPRAPNQRPGRRPRPV